MAELPVEAPERPGAQEWLPAGDGPATVDALRRAAPNCRGCELWEAASQVVFSAGAEHARVAMVGEQPGDVEDQRGIPFVGPAGRLLQRAVDDAGLPRGGLYVTNAVKHFRFERRGHRRIHQTPDVAHIAACRPWLQAELRAVDPHVVVVLGATAARAVLGQGIRVTKDRGQVIERSTSLGVKSFVVTVHPSAVLRVPEEEREPAYAALVDDLRVVTRLLAG
jgi:DNA polymerase